MKSSKSLALFTLSNIRRVQDEISTVSKKKDKREIKRLISYKKKGEKYAEPGTDFVTM